MVAKIITIRGYITKDFMKSRPDWIFLFGDNEKGTGNGGQAHQMRNADNALGIPTKRYPALWPDAYWSDLDYNRARKILANKIKIIVDHIEAGKSIAIPVAGLGTGLSDMKRKCPKICNMLVSIIDALKAKYGEMEYTIKP